MLNSQPFAAPVEAPSGRYSPADLAWRLGPFALAALVFALDRLSKLFIRGHVSAWDTFHVIPGFFNIVHTENPGVAFGMFADATGPVRTVLMIGVSVAVLLLITLVLVRRPAGAAQNLLLRTALALILGGALGNLYDRAVHGTVTDFIEVYTGSHYFPAFNVADSAITAGAALLLLDMWRGRRAESAEATG